MSCHEPLSYCILTSIEIQSDKKEFVKEAKARNKTIFRQKREPRISKAMRSTDTNKIATRNNSLPKLKSLLPDSKRRESKAFSRPIQDQKPRIRQSKKYAHIRSSGYGVASSTLTSSSKDGKKAENATTLPSLNRANPNRLLPTREPARRGRGFRG